MTIENYNKCTASTAHVMPYSIKTIPYTVRQGAMDGAQLLKSARSTKPVRNNRTGHDAPQIGVPTLPTVGSIVLLLHACIMPPIRWALVIQYTERTPEQCNLSLFHKILLHVDDAATRSAVARLSRRAGLARCCSAARDPAYRQSARVFAGGLGPSRGAQKKCFV